MIISSEHSHLIEKFNKAKDHHYRLLTEISEVITSNPTDKERIEELDGALTMSEFNVKEAWEEIKLVSLGGQF